MVPREEKSHQPDAAGFMEAGVAGISKSCKIRRSAAAPREISRGVITHCIALQSSATNAKQGTDNELPVVTMSQGTRNRSGVYVPAAFSLHPLYRLYPISHIIGSMTTSGYGGRISKPPPIGSNRWLTFFQDDIEIPGLSETLIGTSPFRSFARTSCPYLRRCPLRVSVCFYQPAVGGLPDLSMAGMLLRCLVQTVMFLSYLPRMRLSPGLRDETCKPHSPGAIERRPWPYLCMMSNRGSHQASKQNPLGL